MKLCGLFQYSVVTKKSQSQLADDFGRFPPVPLVLKADNAEVNIVTMRGLGEAYYCMAVRLRLLYTLRRDPSSISPKLVEPSDRHWLEVFLQQLLISPLIVWRSYKYLRSKKNGVALFLPMHSRDNYIALRPNVSNRSCLAALVSHEHLHLLQHRYIPNHFVLNPAAVLSEKLANNAGALELLSRVEMEARLHELVLSYYRVSGRLPVTVQEFLALLCGCETPGFAVIEALLEYAAYPKNVVPYTVRDGLFAKDMDKILSAISTLHLRYRFVSEVLPVMYSNLLQYYGDDIHSAAIRVEIARPNLYDDLYGAPSSNHRQEI